MTACTLGVLATLALTTAAAAQSTAFTYQGRLKNGGQLASGLHDFRFRLFDAPSAGNQVGSIQCVDNILVTEGLFTSTFDFGPQFASPSPRFLEIEVRADTGLDCSNIGGFVILAPRPALTAAPLANHARSAFTLAAADGSPADALIVDNSGNVGIGTMSPQAPLHVNGSLRWGGIPELAYSGEDAFGLFLEQQGSSPPTSRIRVQTSKSGDLSNYSQFFVDPSAGFSFMKLGTGNGNVGIGTAAPQAPLDVRGNIRLGSNGQLFAASGVANLQIIHGLVGVGFFPQFGPGYRVERTGEGVYQITFLTPFSDLPSISAMPKSQSGVGGDRLLYDNLAVGGVEVRALRGSALEDTIFTFIAVGPR